MTFWRRPTGRSEVIAKDCMVASSQPLATQAGLEIMRIGGNAVDAAVATAAVLDVVEPFSTGCGGDVFVLLHEPGSARPIGYNGSGISGSRVAIEQLHGLTWTEMPRRGGPPVTVPGAMHAWCTLVREHGQLELAQVFAPAIHYAQEGFPVSPIIAEVWEELTSVLLNKAARDTYLKDGRAPRAGEIMKNPDLAGTLETVAKEGLDSFYSGDIAERIVKTVWEHSGFITIDDMKRQTTKRTDPITVGYRGMDIFEHPPNGQGFAALQMLRLMEEFDFSRYGPLDADRYHVMIEAKKLAYADVHEHNADPDFYTPPLDMLLSKEYARKRKELISMSTAIQSPGPGIAAHSDTVYLATADRDGRAVSFINSLYEGFGSGLVADGTGVKLQNRGSLFSLDPRHPNCFEPNKRPFHTIIPAALYADGEFRGVFGIMGGEHQAQAHAQFVSNMIDHAMGPQAALDHPRFHHAQQSNTVALENGIPIPVQSELRRRGHRLIHESGAGFGGGQAILRTGDVWVGGSDYRKDGQAAGF